MAELVDAHGSGPCASNGVEVRVFSWAPSYFLYLVINFNLQNFFSKAIQNSFHCRLSQKLINLINFEYLYLKDILSHRHNCFKLMKIIMTDYIARAKAITKYTIINNYINSNLREEKGSSNMLGWINVFIIDFIY